MTDQRRTPRPAVDMAVIFVASHNPRYRSAVAWARTAEAGQWRADSERGGLWVGRGWAGDDMRTYGPFDRLRELPYDSGTRAPEYRERPTRPASAGHKFQQLDAPVMGRRWDDV